MGTDEENPTLPSGDTPDDDSGHTPGDGGGQSSDNESRQLAGGSSHTPDNEGGHTPGVGSGTGKKPPLADIDQLQNNKMRYGDFIGELKKGGIQPQHITINGAANVNFGDQNVHGGFHQAGAPPTGHTAPPADDRRTLESISPEELERKYATFHQPAAYETAQATLREKHVVILHGELGIGKYTFALMLARTLDIEAFDVPSTFGLKQLVFSPDSDKRCYVVGNARQNFFSSVGDTHSVSRRMETLRSTGHYLIVVTTDNLGEYTRELAPYTIEVARPNPAVKQSVIRKHVIDMTNDDKVLQDEVLAYVKAPPSEDELTVMGLLQENPSIDMKRLVQLAYDLVATVRLQQDVSELLKQYAGISDEELHEWLSALTDRSDWAFLLALAVFQGERTEVIFQAADLLEKRHPEFFEQKQPQRTRRDRIRGTTPDRPKTRSELPASELYSRYRCHPQQGTYSEELVFDKQRDYARKVLTYYWTEYPTIRAPLCDWMNNIGKTGIVDYEFMGQILKALENDIKEFLRLLKEIDTEENRSIQARVALAVGYLIANRHYKRIHRDILSPWIHEQGQDNTLELVALSLREAFSNGEEQMVQNIADQWYNKGEQERRAAVYINGIVIGQKHPKQALEVIKHALDNADDEEMLLVILEALSKMFVFGQGNPTVLTELFASLDSWTRKDTDLRGSKREQARIKRLFPLYMFMLLGVRYITTDKSVEWPSMLLLARRDKALRTNIASQMVRGLNDRNIREIALVVLEKWCAFADKNAVGGRTVNSIVRQICIRSDERGKDRLYYHFTKWHDRKKDPIHFVSRYFREDSECMQ